MRILVVEDGKRHINAATQQLIGHEVVVCENWKDFMEYHWVPDAYKSDLVYNREKHLEILRRYDVVLTDINIPGMLDLDGTEPESPLGLVIVLRALEAGVKYIGALSDGSHHKDAFIKSLDMWGGSANVFQIGESRVLIKGDCSDFMIFEYEGCNTEENFGKGLKNWEKMLDWLTSNTID